jgi:hypothetical protein
MGLEKMLGSPQPSPDSSSQAKAWGLQVPHHDTQTEPTRIKNPIDPVLSPTVQLCMAKARINEIPMLLFSKMMMRVQRDHLQLTLQLGSRLMCYS